jgi:hypothetical protein
MSSPDNGIVAEADLARVLITWLEEAEWKVYQEVRPHWGDARADVVAVKNDKVWVLETKMNFNFDVLRQVHAWRRRSHLVSIVTPRPRKGYKDTIRETVCRKFDVGWVEWAPNRSWPPGYRFWETVVPPLNTEPGCDSLLEKLSELHNEYGESGSKNSYYTPFRHTCDKLRAYVATNPGIKLVEAMGAIEHHYKDDYSGSNALGKLIREGVVEGLTVEKVKNRIMVYPG